jgi:hypothetical protein
VDSTVLRSLATLTFYKPNQVGKEQKELDLRRGKVG